MSDNSLKQLDHCCLCMRNCYADRNHAKLGYCHMPSELYIARAALHFWEEPCISGTNGSGTIFFSGCSLQCIFCQNHQISNGIHGQKLSIQELSNLFLELQKQGAHNINLVTPTHYIPQIALALKSAKSLGLTIPIVYNTGSYESIDAIKQLDGLIDIYLPDLKYKSSHLSQQYSNCSDYFEVATKNIEEMYRQVQTPIFENGLMKRGVLVRHLLLPNSLIDSKLVLSYLRKTYGDNIYVSIMSQFTPVIKQNKYLHLNRRVTESEYHRLVSYAQKLGYTNAYTQDRQTAKESFIPPFVTESNT